MQSPRKYERERAGFHRDFDARAQIIQRFQNRGNISGAGMFVVRLGKISGRVAVIGDVESGGLQPIRDPGGAQRRGRAFVPGAKGRCARGRAQQDNILRLTGDLDRQSRSPEVGDVLP